MKLKKRTILRIISLVIAALFAGSFRVKER